MKKSIFICLLTLVGVLHRNRLNAQNGILFTYDAAGNRVKRELYIGCQGCLAKKGNKEPQKDSLTNAAVTIFPNPTQGHLAVSISTSSPEQIVTKLFVFDLAGKLMAQKQVINSGSENFDLTNYPTGVYQLKLESKDETSFWKILKE